MTPLQYSIFSDFRSDFRSYCDSLNSRFASILSPLQKNAAKEDTPEYPIEWPVVYNTSLDELTEESEIRLIVIGDNPGKNEQLSVNQKYLVGQSGKIAAGFFVNNPSLNTDFRKNVIILNKTPVHTAKTKHLRYLQKNGGSQIEEIINESQLYMARKTAELHVNMCKAALEGGIEPDLWLVGYAELKNKGLFTKYRDELKKSYSSSPKIWDKVFVFQHFSMNRFTIDLRTYMKENTEKSLKEALEKLGEFHKKEIFDQSL